MHQKNFEEAAHLHKTIIPVLLETYSDRDYPNHYTELTQQRLQETQYVDLRSKDRYKYDDLSPLWGAINQAQRPELSTTERWILWHQLEILRVLRKDKVDKLWDETPHQILLSHGYERHYSLITPLSEESMSFNDGEEVWQILDMFDMIENALMGINMSNTAVVVPDHDLEFLRFRGFRENGEYFQYQYAQILVKKDRLFQKAMRRVPSEKVENREMHMLPVYQKMLVAWRKSKNIRYLIREDLLRIAAAGKPPYGHL